MLRLVLLILALLPLPALAGMSAEEFEAYTTGKTLHYSVNGQDYGVERYLEGRRVEWSFLDGDCKAGTWYEDAGRICFAYEDWGDPQCWVFTQTPTGLIAQFADRSEDGAVYRAYEKDEPMVCLGPKVGV